MKRKRSDWQHQERIVAFLEAHLAPDANVEQDVRLPVLASQSGRRAQCDVVIREGAPPRQTMTIVEVQKRGRPIEIKTFRGWLAKMREVGAHGLYCVSTEPIPQTIKELAEQTGPTVRLIRLAEVADEEKKNIKFHFDPWHYKADPTFSIIDIVHLVLEPHPSELEIVANKKAFTSSVHGDEVRYSMNEMIRATLNATIGARLPEPFRLPYRKRTRVQLGISAPEGPYVYFHAVGTRHLVKSWVVEVEIEIAATRFPVDVRTSAYVQTGTDEPLAWLHEATIGGAKISVAGQRDASGTWRVSALAEDYPTPINQCEDASSRKG